MSAPAAKIRSPPQTTTARTASSPVTVAGGLGELERHGAGERVRGRAVDADRRDPAVGFDADELPHGRPILADRRLRDRSERVRCTCNSLLHSPAWRAGSGRPSNVDVISALRERGLRMTPQRRAIVAEIMRTQGHISPTALARKVQGDMPGVNASTIYRTLALLEEMGVLAHAHLESGAEYHRTEEAGHVHLTCSNCGDEDDLSIGEADALIRLIEQHHGFEPDLTHFAIGGLCADCKKARGAAG